jgi:hypothetical protein
VFPDSGVGNPGVGSGQVAVNTSLEEVGLALFSDISELQGITKRAYEPGKSST